MELLDKRVITFPGFTAVGGCRYTLPPPGYLGLYSWCQLLSPPGASSAWTSPWGAAPSSWTSTAGRPRSFSSCSPSCRPASPSSSATPGWLFPFQEQNNNHTLIDSSLPPLQDIFYRSSGRSEVQREERSENLRGGREIIGGNKFEM